MTTCFSKIYFTRKKGREIKVFSERTSESRTWAESSMDVINCIQGWSNGQNVDSADNQRTVAVTAFNLTPNQLVQQT